MLSFASSPGTLIYWGSVDWFHLTPPANLTNVVSVTVGSQNGLALTGDGQVIGWGNGNDFGAGTPPAGLSNVTAIASGSVHSLALKSDGTVVGWGDNSNGEISIPPSLSNVVAIAAGNYFSMALTADGRVSVWGSLGVASTVTNVPSDLSNVVAIAGGRDNCLAATAEGTVVAWGEDDFGQSDVPPGLSGVTNVGAGFDYSVALRQDGTVVSWGGVTNYPVGVSNLVAVAGGPEAAHCLALRNDGQVVGWGDDLFYPLDGPAPYTNLLAIGAGYGVSFGITLEPVILSPPADSTCLAGTNLTLSATVIGTVPWSSQWFYNGTNLPGQTSNSLQLTNVQVGDSGLYSVLVSNQYGALLSSSATVTVQPFPPGIVVQPTNETELAGATTLFTVGVVGAPPFGYQWYFNNGLVPGATNAALALTNTTDANAGTYYLVITNQYGTNTSSVATLNVNDPPAVSGTTQELTLPAGTNWILRTAASGTPPLSYQWLFDGTNLPGATNVSLVLGNLQAASAGQYQIAVSNLFGVVTNLAFTVQVADSGPILYSQPVSQDFIPGTRVALAAQAYGSAPLRVQWWHDGNPVAGGTNLTLWLANAQTNDAGSYALTISNAFGSLTSSTATLSVGDPYPGQTDWPSLSFTQLTTNAFSAPTCIQHASPGDPRLFVLEKQGRIWIIQSNAVIPQPFLAISDRVQSSGAEQGLLGFAVPPGFATNQHFYVDYTRKPDGATVISRFQVSTNANVADTNSETVLLVIPQPYANHNGGQLAFGPDGFLYIGKGDGGNTTVGDPFRNGQNPAVLLGKILRLDVESGAAPYAVPASNPFVGNTNDAPEIWALGLRNPWRFSFDRQTGDLYVGDVGQDRYEEIDFQPAGARGGQNYGWRIFEGPAPYLVPAGFTNSALLTAPVAWYDHSVGAAVIGGYVYRGSQAPRMNGIYFYGDFLSGWIWGLKQAATNWQSLQLIKSAFGPSTFGEDADGNLYLADYRTGQIFQIGDAQSALAPTISPNGGSFANDQSVKLATASPGATIHYTLDGRDPTEFDPGVGSGSSIPIGGTLTLKVRAFRPDLSPSQVVAANFAFGVSTPSFSPAAGPIANNTLVSMSTASESAEIRYTLDGSDPGPASALYSGPVLLNGKTLLRARARKPGYADSAIATVFYDWATVAAPEISPPSGVVTNGTVASITCALAGAEIHYTTDGSVPNLSSPVYRGPFPLLGNSTVQAAAWATNYGPSGPVIAQYALLDYRPTIVQTYAGQLQAGYADGAALQAQFSAPQGVCVDPTGKVYVADTGNNRIREILTNGQVVTFAGSGLEGTLDGIGTNATFSSPTGVALDQSNNLYVADSGHNLLRKILPDGTVTTLANLAGSPAQIPVLSQLVVDGNGTVYVGGYLEVFAVNATGAFTNFAGPGFCCPPDWSGGMGLTLDGNGGLFATITASPIAPYARVVELSSNAQYQVYAGDLSGYTDGPRQIARFLNPLDVARDGQGGLVVSDWIRIRAIDLKGNVQTLAGSDQGGYQNGPGLTAQFNQVYALAVDSSGSIYVADSGNNCIRKISRDTGGVGISDAWQMAHFGHTGVDPASDPDHDGMSNFAEFWAGTDPLDPTSFLEVSGVVIQAGGVVQVSWQSVAGKLYAVEFSDDLINWAPLGASVVGDGTFESVTDPTPISQAPHRAYRISVRF